MEPTGSEKVLNKNITINLLILTTAVLVLVQFCELLISRSSCDEQSADSVDCSEHVTCSDR